LVDIGNPEEVIQYPTCYGTLNEYFQKISSLDLNDFAEIPNEILDTSSSSPSTPAITPFKRSRIDLESPSSHGKKQREIKRQRNERRNTPKKNPVESGLKILGDSIVKASENKMAHQSANLVAAMESSNQNLMKSMNESTAGLNDSIKGMADKLSLFLEFMMKDK
jgi:hypothetical protein